MNLIKKKENFIMLLAIIIFLTINNFFYNFYFILKKDYSERMNYHYGYCNVSGYGFLEHIVKKYKLKANEIAFLSSNTFDVSGSGNYGFSSVWVNRNSSTFDNLDYSPKDEVKNLRGLLDIV